VIGVGQPPEDAHGSPAADADAAALSERRARRDLPAELDRLRARVGEQRRLLQAQLEQTERTIADVRTGAMELALRLTAEQDARRTGAVASPPAPDARPAPFADAPAPAPQQIDLSPEAAAEPPDHAAPLPAAPVDPETASLIEGLQRAAERLRTQVGERDDEATDADEPRADVDAEDDAAEPEVEPEVAAELEAEVVAPPESEVVAPPESEPEVVAEPEPTPPPPPLAVLEPRREQPVGRTPWLTDALDRLVALDREHAAVALTALIPAQASRSRRDLVYDLAVVGSGTWRVRLQSGTGAVGPLLGGPASDREIDFVLSGPAGALVPLAAGGARRRLPGTLATGRRRRLRRLLRDLRAPMTLVDLIAGATTVDAAVLLELLAVMVDPAWTAEHAFIVDYDVSGSGERHWRVAVGDGVRTGPAPGVRDADATVSVPDTALAALLAGVALPAGATATVSGSVEVVELLHGWFDAVQGASA